MAYKDGGTPEGCSVTDQLLIVPRSGKLGGEGGKKMMGYEGREDGANLLLFFERIEYEAL